MGKHSKAKSYPSMKIKKAIAFSTIVSAPFVFSMINSPDSFASALPSQQSSVNWDAIAHCESGNNWSTSTGNGFYGGLQFTESTWLSYGGGAYAPSANRASQSEQITIAGRVLAGQGIGAWPVCGKHSGSSQSYSAQSSIRITHSARTTIKKNSSHSSSKVIHHSPIAHLASPSHTYIVKGGEYLSEIAHDNGMTWRDLFALNANIIKNPNLIFSGERLTL
jgi:hypothetical protein